MMLEHLKHSCSVEGGGGGESSGSRGGQSLGSGNTGEAAGSGGSGHGSWGSKLECARPGSNGEFDVEGGVAGSSGGGEDVGGTGGGYLDGPDGEGDVEVDAVVIWGSRSSNSSIFKWASGGGSWGWAEGGTSSSVGALPGLVVDLGETVPSGGSTVGVADGTEGFTPAVSVLDGGGGEGSPTTGDEGSLLTGPEVGSGWLSGTSSISSRGNDTELNLGWGKSGHGGGNGGGAW